jgi:hypothetical protein
MSKFLSRNFHLAAGAILVASLALFCRLLTGGEWVTLTLGVVTAFRAGDAIVNWVQTKASKE